MREIDRRAQEEFGIPELLLMEHAGKAAAEEAMGLLSKGADTAREPAVVSCLGPLLVLCGAGANGGDGFVAARHLHNWGVKVSVVLPADRNRVFGSARVNLKIVERLSIPLEEVSSPSAWRRWAGIGHRSRFRLVVDALLGTGISGRVREPFRSAIAWINRQSCPVVSIDVPSGLSADTGRPCGVAVRASSTVACGLPKTGLLRREARPWVGRLSVADIGLPRALRR